MASCSNRAVGWILSFKKEKSDRFEGESLVLASQSHKDTGGRLGFVPSSK